MSEVQLYVTAAEGPLTTLLQFRWNTEKYPELALPFQQRGLLRVNENPEGVARAVWYATMPGAVILPDGVDRYAPTDEEYKAAEEQVAVSYVQSAVNPTNYKRLVRLLLPKHRQARKEVSEFAVVCAAACGEIEDYQKSAAGDNAGT